MTQARLCQIEGDGVFARQLLEKADDIFEAIGTTDEPVRVRAALEELKRRLLEHSADGTASLWSSPRRGIDDFQIKNG